MKLLLKKKKKSRKTKIITGNRLPKHLKAGAPSNSSYLGWAKCWDICVLHRWKSKFPFTWLNAWKTRDFRLEMPLCISWSRSEGEIRNTILSLLLLAKPNSKYQKSRWGGSRGMGHKVPVWCFLFFSFCHIRNGKKDQVTFIQVHLASESLLVC